MLNTNGEIKSQTRCLFTARLMKRRIGWNRICSNHIRREFQMPLAIGTSSHFFRAISLWMYRAKVKESERIGKQMKITVVCVAFTLVFPTPLNPPWYKLFITARFLFVIISFGFVCWVRTFVQTGKFGHFPNQFHFRILYMYIFVSIFCWARNTNISLHFYIDLIECV